MIEAIAVVKN